MRRLFCRNDPTNKDRAGDPAAIFRKVGDAYRLREREEDAIVSYRSAVEIGERLYRVGTRFEHGVTYARAHGALSSTLLTVARAAEASAHKRRAIEILGKYRDDGVLPQYPLYMDLLESLERP